MIAAQTVNVIWAMVPFEASTGSVIVMEGRVWHTSGGDVTADEDRALLFGYSTKPFLRPQWNFTASLSDARKAAATPELPDRLGLDATLNMAFNDVFGAGATSADPERCARQDQPRGAACQARTVA